MNITLQKSKIKKQQSIIITGSKSESNRLLLLQALYPEITLDNVSNSDDSQLMQKALQSNSSIVDIHHAGTAMRFLTAYFATRIGREVTLTGSKRMKERPIKILVNALRDLGADITYTENEGYPPLKIKGKELVKDKVTLKANVSSQYISALLLMAPKLENGLELTLDGKITSVPYIKMTLALLTSFGASSVFKNNTIQVHHLLKSKNSNALIESDWSSASYFYSLIALSELETRVTLSAYKKESLQGDSVLADIYQYFGVDTTFNNNTIQLNKTKKENSKRLEFDLSNAPDTAQTIAVTAFGLGLECHLTGLHTLKIKETDRLVALKTELEKLGAFVHITQDSLHLKASNAIKQNVSINTYKDHRMAMAFAPLALKQSLIINDAEVVSKSYPDFWKDLQILGFQISQ